MSEIPEIQQILNEHKKKKKQRDELPDMTEEWERMQAERQNKHLRSSKDTPPLEEKEGEENSPSLFSDEEEAVDNNEELTLSWLLSEQEEDEPFQCGHCGKEVEENQQYCECGVMLQWENQ